MGICSLTACILSGCVGFEHQWQRSVAAYRTGEVETPEGPWQGTWKTTDNDHTGNLRAIVSRDPETPGEYRFHYHATWSRFLSGTFKTAFPAEWHDDRWQVEGEHDMGLFGTFRHRATITDEHFEATYEGDRGTVGRFSLERPDDAE